MNLREWKCYEPDTTFDIRLAHERFRCAIGIHEAAGIQAALTVIPEKEVLAFRNLIRDGGAITTLRRVLKGVTSIAIGEVFLWEFYGLFFSLRLHVHIATLNGDLVTGLADDALDVVLAVIRWRTEHDDVSTLGRANVVGKFIDDDVFTVFQSVDHRMTFYLKRRDEEGADTSHDRDNHRDIEEDIEQLVPKSCAELFFSHKNREIVARRSS